MYITVYQSDQTKNIPIETFSCVELPGSAVLDFAAELEGEDSEQKIMFDSSTFQHLSFKFV